MSNQRFTDEGAWSALTLLRRHRIKLVILPAIAVLLGLSVIVWMPRTYRSQAKLFLQIGRESVGIDPTAAIGRTIAMQQSGRDDEVQSAMEVLQSREVIGAAVKLVGVDAVLDRSRAGASGKSTSSPVEVLFAVPQMLVGWVQSLDRISDLEEAVITAERGLQVSAKRGSAVIAVGYEAATPQLAQQICDAIISSYQQEHARIHRNPSSSDFFDDQRDLLRTQLDSAEESLRRAKNELGLASVDARRQTLEAQFSAVALQSYEVAQEMATATARVSDLERQLKDLPERMTSAKKSVPNVGADLLQGQYYALQLKEMELKSRFSEQHPLVQAVTQQAEEARHVIDAIKELRFETTDDINPEYRELSLELKRQVNTQAGLQARLSALRDQEAQVQADMKSVNQSEVRVAQLERDVDIARQKYRQYAEYFEESRIDSELQRARINNVSVVQAPTLQEKPVSPSKLLVALATMFLATFGTIAAVLTSEQLHRHQRPGNRMRRVTELPVRSNVRHANGEQEPAVMAAR